MAERLLQLDDLRTIDSPESYIFASRCPQKLKTRCSALLFISEVSRVRSHKIIQSLTK